MVQEADNAGGDTKGQDIVPALKELICGFFLMTEENLLIVLVCLW